MAGLSNDYETVIRELLELEYDAIDAYKAAIERLESIAYRDKLRDFLNDHDQHVAGLKALAASEDILLPDSADLKRILTRGKVILASPAGDGAILAAMKTNEDDTVTAYERASRHKDLPSVALPLMQGALAHEQRHRAWMEQNAYGTGAHKSAA
jgi:bacterioferritin (cytochrome b1)